MGNKQTKNDEEMAQTLQLLLNMGFTEPNALEAVSKHPTNIKFAIDYATKLKKQTVDLAETEIKVNDEKYEANQYDIIQEAYIDSSDKTKRKPIYETEHKNEDIIKCIGSLWVTYSDKLAAKENALGTGTIIKIDSNKRCYVLTVAHNGCKPLRQCSNTNCKTKTIRNKCANCKCKTNIQKPFYLVEPEKIEFCIHCVVKQKVDVNTKQTYEFGDVEKIYNISETYLSERYQQYVEKYQQCNPSMCGYDIAIMAFHCTDQDDAELYNRICPKIRFQTPPDKTFGGHQNMLCIYGYPSDKKSKNGEYEMHGMSTGISGHGFITQTHNKTGELYIVNNTIDTQPGQSGSAIWSCDNEKKDNYIIYGIHSAGKSGKKGQNGINYGTFLNHYNLGWIQRHIGIEFKDKFDINSVKYHKIEVNGNIARSIGGWDTIFLDKRVCEGKHHWKFKMLQYNVNGYVFVGLWKNGYGNKILGNYYNGFLGEKANHAYVFDGRRARCNKISKNNSWSSQMSYGQPLKQNDIIEMGIDFDSNSISYRINNGKSFTPFIDIDNCSYNAAISLYFKGDAVELL
eukprot:60514_1